MQTVRHTETCDFFGYSGVRCERPVLPWHEDCLDDAGIFDWRGAVAENWQSAIPTLLADLAATLRANWKDAVRLESIERDLLTLKMQFTQLQRSCPSVVLIDTLAPEPLEVIRPFHVTVEPYEGEYRASFVDANLSTFGETRAEAIWALKDIIAATFEVLSDAGEKKLGPGPARQFFVLREFIRKP
jgi:predicted RNase H-like HicB family nuclease